MRPDSISPWRVRLIPRAEDADKPIFVDVRVSAYLDETGNEERLRWLLRDVTAACQAEEELHRARDLAACLIDMPSLAILLLDQQGKIVRFNPCLEALTGYAATEVLGRDWAATLIPETAQDEARQTFSAVLEGECRVNWLMPIQTRSGPERRLEWGARALRTAAGQVEGVILVGRDTTELHEAHERLLQTERLAAIGQTITGLAHESRNALQRTQACLEMLALQMTDRPQALQFIQRIQDAQDRLQHLLEDVRRYAAPIRLEPVLCNLASSWRDAWDHLEGARRSRNVRLVEVLPADALPCRADPFRMVQLFRNILENALMASASPGRITVQADAATLGCTPAWRVAVQDQGPGFAEDQLEKLGEPFYTTKTQGTGLGLAIARRIAEAHGGTLEARNQPQGGAEVVITIPRGQP